MAAGFRFDPDQSGIEAVATGAGVASALDEAAKQAETHMRNLAGKMKSADFFDFAKSIRTVKSRRVGDEHVAYVGSDSPGWHLQEFGTARIRPRAIIRRGMKQSGIRFEEGR